MRKRHGVSGANVAREAMEKFAGVTLSDRTVRRSTPDTLPRPRGVQGPIPKAGEEYTAKLVRARRALKFPVFEQDVINMAAALVEGTSSAARFEDFEVRRRWYRRFLEFHGLLTGNQRPLEMKREEWATSHNIALHYECLEKTFIDAGVAQRNPDFDPEVPNSQPILITKPERIVSFDETRLQMDMTEVGSGNQMRTVRAGKEDTGETLAAKGGGDASGVGGSTAAGGGLPPMFILAGQSIDIAWLEPPMAPDGPPTSTIIDPTTGEPFEATFFPNTKGGMAWDTGPIYFRHNILPVFDPPPSQESPVVGRPNVNHASRR